MVHNDVGLRHTEVIQLHGTLNSHHCPTYQSWG